MVQKSKALLGTSLILWIVASCLTLLGAGAAFADDNALEYAVKAVDLYKFGDFVDWPASAFETSSSPVNLCIAGDDPFGSSIDALLSGRRIGDRPVVVRHLASVGRNSGCQILFIGGDNPQDISPILNAVAGTGVLTVTDTGDAGTSGSIIRFVIDDDHVRFVIDAQAATANKISVSSKLLSLAVAATPNR